MSVWMKTKEELLVHYGKLGMHWGKRNQAKKSSTRS